MFRMNLLAMHRLLIRNAFYPLLLCTILCFAFLATRFHYTGEFRYRFLVWNLFLAWMPYWCSVAAAWLDHNAPTRKGLKIALVGAAWLVMFPNAPYIFTDFIHVIQYPSPRWWYDVGLVSAYALTGCFLGVVSLRIMHDIVRRRAGEFIGWLTVLATAALSGFGIYLGRFERLNSWDVLLRPQAVFADAITRIADPFSHPRTMGVTLMFGAIVLMTYIVFTTSQRIGHNPSTSAMR
jgi:uncharacterized membrane protein